MLGHSVSYYLPKFWATTPLYAEKIIPLLDHFLSVDSPIADKLALAYYDIWNKYTSPEDMTEESIKAYIRDHGYGYILDLLSLSSNSYQTLLYLLPLIHFLKGSREGLEVVFSLLQVTTQEAKTKITAWYESDPVMEEDTFEIVSEIDLATIDASFFEKFDTFIQKYVYPSLTSLNVSYSVSGGFTLLPVLMTKIEVNLYGDMDAEP
jgi:hypothetical protein